MPQPNGESHPSQPGPRSPAARSTSQTPMTARAIPPQVRVLAESWHATAASPVPTRPVPSQPRPNAIDPAGSSPATMFASAPSRPTATDARTPSATAACSGAWRATRVAPVSSARPDSSSVLRWRRTTTRAMPSTNTAYITVILLIASSPALDSLRIGPYSATRAGLVLIRLAAATRSAASGYSPSMVNADAATIAVRASTHTGSSTRSRRRAARSSATAPVLTTSSGRRRGTVPRARAGSPSAR